MNTTEIVLGTSSCKEFKTGWSVSFDRIGSWYHTIVRNARGDIHDKMRCDDYRTAREYYRAFCGIARNA